MRLRKKSALDGVGGLGVEPNGSSMDDDKFTDFQPEKEEILNGGGEPVPALDTLNSYGEYGDFKLVGHGERTNERCGTFFRFKGCDRVDLHDIVTIDGQSFESKVFVRRVHHWCHKPSCPVCYKHGWAVREAHKIDARLMEASKFLGQIEHVVMGVPPKYFGLPFKKIRKKVSDAMLRRGVVGGCLIFHAFRFSVRRQWYYSPHFHVIGFILGGYAKCRKCKNKICIRSGNGDNFDMCDGFEARTRKHYVKDGFIAKVLGERKTAFGTGWYQLNHASYRKKEGKAKRHVVATWFGVCSYRKLKVTPEKKKELCPICQHELKYLQYVGKPCLVKHKDDPDYCRDSFEDFLDSDGHVRWVEAPKRKSPVDTRFFGGLSAKEWIAQGLSVEEKVAIAYDRREKLFSHWD